MWLSRKIGSMSKVFRRFEYLHDMKFVGQYTTREWHRLNYRGLGTRLEGIGQSTLAAVLTVIMESHLNRKYQKSARM